MILDYGAVNQRIAEFDKRHGASVYDEGWIRFEDGAVRESNPLGLMMEPPDDHWERSKRKLIHRKIVFQRALRAFDERRQHYISHTRANLNNQQFCGPALVAAEVAETELAELKQAVRAAQEGLARAEAEVEANKPQRLKELAQESLRNRQSNEHLLDRVQRIEL